MNLSYYIITSDIGNKTNTEGFFIEQEMETALNALEEIVVNYFNQDCIPMDNGTIGYYNSNGDKIYLEERNVNKIQGGVS